MWTIEAIFIGKISAAAFGGVGMAIQVLIVSMAILLTLIVGASLIITRHLGADKFWEANHILGQTMMIAVIMALLLSLLWYFGAPQVLNLIRDESGEAKLAGVTYLKTVSLFGPFIVINFMAVGLIRGSGETFKSMCVSLLVNGTNIILAPILIFGLFGFERLEVFGAALAVGISHTIGFCTSLYLLRSRKCTLFLSFRELTTPNWRTFKRLISAGLPTTIEQLVWSLGLLVVSTYAALIGITVLAAHQVFLRIQSILSMIYMGFGFAAMTLMGKNLGAERRKLAEKTAETASLVVFIFVFFIIAIVIIFSDSLISAFTNDPQVIRTGAIVVKLFALVQIPKAVDGVLMGNLRGAGDLKWLMWITIVSVLIFEIGFNWGIVFVFNLSIWGLWLMHIADETLRLILNYWRYRGGKWKFIDV